MYIGIVNQRQCACLKPAVIRDDQTKMEQGKLQEWAIKIVEEIVDSEAKAMSAKETGFYLGKEDQNLGIYPIIFNGRICESSRGKRTYPPPNTYGC